MIFHSIRVFLLLFIFTQIFSTKSIAERTVELDAHVVLKGSTDTVYKVLFAKRQVLVNDQLTFTSILESPLKFSENGISEKIKIKNIEYLEFVDLQGVKRVFVQKGSIGLKDRRRKLVEVIYTGTIMFCRSYKQNLHAGNGYAPPSLATRPYKPTIFGGTPYTYTGIDYFIYDDYEIVKLNLYWKRDRKEFIKMIPDRQDLHNRVLEIKTYEELAQILKDYDTDPEVIEANKSRNSDEELFNTLKILNSIDSVNTKQIESVEELKVGDFIKYVGPGPEKFGYVKKIISSKVVKMEYGLSNEAKSLLVRVSDVELIVE